MVARIDDDNDDDDDDFYHHHEAPFRVASAAIDLKTVCRNSCFITGIWICTVPQTEAQKRILSKRSKLVDELNSAVEATLVSLTEPDNDLGFNALTVEELSNSTTHNDSSNARESFGNDSIATQAGQVRAHSDSPTLSTPS